ncbi:hypothetical protein F4819DRAFT_491619 [Hypoxylon fuscum]|nr:hypothetical protein F4819DRAFT_491619 [Hypoxylon fuscum]
MVGTTLHSIISWEPDSESDLKFFQSIPWCAEVICTPKVRPYQGASLLRTSRGTDPVIQGFMFRDGGILRHCSLVAEANAIPHLDSHQSGAKTPSSQDPLYTQNDYPVHIDLFTLGPALYGAPNRIHGGVLALLADGICAKAAWIHRDPTKQLSTAYTNVRFLRPSITGPDGTITIMVKSQISQQLTRQGKVVVNASFEGPGGVVYATSESMIVEKAWKTRL